MAAVIASIEYGNMLGFAGYRARHAGVGHYAGLLLFIRLCDATCHTLFIATIGYHVYWRRQVAWRE